MKKLLQKNDFRRFPLFEIFAQMAHIPYLEANNDPNDENRLRQQAMDFLWENRSVLVLSKISVEKMGNQFT